MSKSPDYQESLKDPRWQRKRLRIMENAEWSCEDCGRRDKELQVHHCHYIRAFRFEPWSYPDELLICVCADCHLPRQDREEAVYIAVAKIMRRTPIESLEYDAWAFIERVLHETKGIQCLKDS